MIRLILIFMMCFGCAAFFAQAPDTLWTKTFGGSDFDTGQSVQQTSDEGYILVGTTYSFGLGESDVWLVKTDYKGDTLWTKTFGGNFRDFGFSVQQTFDGGYIIAGETSSSYNSGANGWLIKTDSNGNTIWTKTFGGNGQLNSVQQTSDSGYIATGHTYSAGTGLSYVWLIKTNALGDTLWTKTFVGRGGSCVRQTTDGGYIITAGIGTVGRLVDDLWLIKTNLNGDTLWTKTIGDSLSDSGRSVQQTTDEGYIITGGTGFESFDGHTLSGDLWLIKTDSNGDTLWSKVYGGDRVSDIDFGSSVQQTLDGGYIITGGTNNQVWLLRTDAIGDTLWTRTFGGSYFGMGNSVRQTSDGGYIITGNAFYIEQTDILLIKTTADATFIDENPNASIKTYLLQQNYPNPFNPSTKLRYSLPQNSNVVIKVYDVLGEEIETLVMEEKPAGNYELTWNASNLPSGVYFYQLKAGDFIQTKKMVLLK